MVEIKTHRLLIDFATPDGLIRFIDKAMEHGLIPKDTVGRDHYDARLHDRREYILKGRDNLRNIKLP